MCLIAGSVLGKKWTEKRRQKMIKPCFQYDLNGNFINSYLSVKEAGDKMKIYSSNITDCTHGIIRTAGGFIWTSGLLPTEEQIKKANITLSSCNFERRKPCYQYDLNGLLIKKYESEAEATKQTKIHRSCISGCLKGINKTAGGFIWKCA